MRRAAPYPAAASGDDVDLPLEEAWAEDTAIALALAHADPFPDFPQKLIMGDVYVNVLAFTIRLPALRR